MKNEQFIAIILAAGQGSRMKSEIAKQYMSIQDKPMLYYSLAAFEKSSVDKIIVVVGKDEIDYCKYNVIEKYGIKKSCKVIAGGAERYLSVYCALEELNNDTDVNDTETYVLIHDAARPLLSRDIIEETCVRVKHYKAVAVGVPTKDTIKIVNESGEITHTPKRSLTYIIQTPQAFNLKLLKESYDKVMNTQGLEITDDAMIVENGSEHKVHIVQGDYINIKVTTPEDIVVAESYLQKNIV